MSNQDEMKLRGLLRWIADRTYGGESSIDIGDLEVPLVEHALREHRVSAQFLRKISSHPQTPGAKELKKAASAVRSSSLAEARRYSADVEHLDQAFRALKHPVILLKGLAAAQSLGDNDLIRESSDIDILPHPTEATRVASILEGAGYSDAGEVMPHEAGSYEHPERHWVDLHRSVPVWDYVRTGSIGSSALRTNSRELSYFDLSSLGILPHPGRNSIVTTGVDATMVVIVAQIFRDYVETPFNARIAKVRLGEILAAVSLLKLSSARARAIVYGGVKFVLAATEQLYNRSQHEEGAVVRNTLFPREVGRGVLAPIALNVDNLLIRSPGFDDLKEALQFIELPQAGGRIVFLSGDPRLYSHRSDNWLNEIVLSCTLRDGVYNMRIEVTFQSSACYKDELQISGGNSYFYLSYSAEESSSWVYQTGVGASLTVFDWSPLGFVAELALNQVEYGSDYVVAVQRFEEAPTTTWNHFYQHSLRTAVSLITVR